MQNSRKGQMVVGLSIVIVLTISFFYSRYVDRQVDKYAMKIHMQKWREENLKCGTVTYGPYISFRETLQHTSKIKP